MRGTVSLVLAIALTTAGAALSYLEFTAGGHLPPKLWWIGPFMALAGGLWLLDDLRG